jgi:tetratricopeptide (TPR) repeat protein
MVRENVSKDSLESDAFLIWTPEVGRSVAVGADRRTLPLPRIPLPVHREDVSDDGPSDDAIGRGLYDYLRQFPDCPYNADYAELLREAYPHYLADLGAQIVLLDSKEVDAPYIHRKITYMKILSLLDPGNGGLLQRLGMACYDIGHMFSELGFSRCHFLAAMGYFQRSLKCLPGDPTSLNYLGQIDFILGDYPGAARYWAAVISAMDEGAGREGLRQRISRIEAREVPDHPLVDDLEAIGEAMALYGKGEIREARTILDSLEEKGTVPAEFPSPEFYYLLGMCRGKEGEVGGAFEAFEKSLELDPDYAPAREGKDRLLQEGGRL